MKLAKQVLAILFVIAIAICAAACMNTPSEPTDGTTAVASVSTTAESTTKATTTATHPTTTKPIATKSSQGIRITGRLYGTTTQQTTRRDYGISGSWNPNETTTEKATTKAPTTTRPTTTKPTTTHPDDPYDVYDYWDPEDFYEDHWDDFFDYYDAEEYFYDHQ